MYQLRIKNAETDQDYRTLDLSEEEWLRWREILLRARLCKPEDLASPNKRLTITYYPGTFPVPAEDDEILSLL